MHPFSSLSWRCLFLVMAMVAPFVTASAQSDAAGPSAAATPHTVQPVAGAAITAVGPGDTLEIMVLGQPDLTTQVTIDADGDITVPFLGNLQVSNQSPAQIARRIEQGLSRGGYLQAPQVVINVTRVRSRVASILGEIQRPGRYPIEGRLSLLELLSIAGGMRADAGDVAVVIRPSSPPIDEEQRFELTVRDRSPRFSAVQDMALEPGDVVYIPAAPRFFIYGEVGQPGSYPMEEHLNVMKAVSLAGGLNARASDRRISISREDALTGETKELKATLTDPVRPGDVVHVDERWF